MPARTGISRRRLLIGLGAGLLAGAGAAAFVERERIGDFWTTRVLTGHLKPVAGVAFSPDGQTLASGSEDGYVRLWRVADAALIRRIDAHHSTVNAVAFSPDGLKLATASNDETVSVWQVADGKLLLGLSGVPDHPVSDTFGLHYALASVAFSPDGLTVCAGYGDGTVHVWNAADGRALPAFVPPSILPTQENTPDIPSLAFSPDARTMVTGARGVFGKNAAHVFNVADGSEIRSLTGHTSAILAVAYAPDGKVIATGSVDTTVRLWNASDGTAFRTIVGGTDIVFSVAFSPNGELLAVGGNSTIRVWRVNNGALVRTLHGHSTYVRSVAFSPDGTLLASGSEDQTVRLWRM